MAHSLTRDAIINAAKDGDAEAIANMLDHPEFETIVRRIRPHPICRSITAPVAELLLPFARRLDLTRAIYDALICEPFRPDIIRVIVEKGRARLGLSLRNGHISFLGTTALHLACEYGCAEAIPQLLALKPDLEMKSADDATALALAVRCRRVEIVQKLLDAGSDPGPGIPELASGSDMDEPAAVAISRLLILAGARTTAAAGTLLRILPVDRWHLVLSQAAPTAAWSREEVTVAFSVVDLSFAQRLLEAGADPTAAQLGALHNPRQEVLSLVAPTLKDLSREALSELVLFPDLLQRALAEGLPVNARDSHGWTLLTAAAWQLGDKRADQARDNLYRAIEILLAAGADRTGRRGRASPLRAFFLEALPDVQEDSLRWLLQHGLRDPLAPHYLARRGSDFDTRFLSILFEFGFSPNIIDSRGRTPLHLLADREDEEEGRQMLDCLLTAGADATIKDKENRTPLDIALQVEDSPVVEGLRAEQRRLRTTALRQTTYTSPAKRLRTMRL